MGKSESKVGTAVEPGLEDSDKERSRAESRAKPPAAPARPRGRAATVSSPFRVVKPGQGIHVRWGTAIGAAVLAVAGAHFVWTQIQLFRFAENYYVRTLVPVVFLLVALYFIFWLVGRNQTAIDFMIATEGEMKKVNWSTRREVWGATRVVIVTVLALGLMLAVVDAMFMLLFGSIGVLRHVKILEVFFGSGGEG